MITHIRTVLEHTGTVYTLLHTGPQESAARFDQRDPDLPPGLHPKACVIPLEDWRAMGCPEQITITVEPGDQISHIPPQFERKPR